MEIGILYCSHNTLYINISTLQQIMICQTRLLSSFSNNMSAIILSEADMSEIQLGVMKL